MHNLKKNGEAPAYSHASRQYGSYQWYGESMPFTSPSYEFSCPCVDILQLSKMVGTVAEKERRMEELEEAKSPHFPHPFSWELRFMSSMVDCIEVMSMADHVPHWSKSQPWPMGWLPVMTPGLSKSSSLWALTTGILVWPSLPHPACPPPWLGLWERQSPAGLHGCSWFSKLLAWLGTTGPCSAPVCGSCDHPWTFSEAMGAGFKASTHTLACRCLNSSMYEQCLT